MKIYGDNTSTQFRTLAQEPGLIYGHDDVLLGERQQVDNFTSGICGSTDAWRTIQPKLHLHISNSPWASFTGLLREYCLPWRWKAAYLDHENGMTPERILICTDVREGRLSSRLESVIGKSLFEINLTQSEHYTEIDESYYVRIPIVEGDVFELEHMGIRAVEGQVRLCPIYRIRGIFSLVIYHLLMNFCSSQWEEVALRAGQASENVLIKRYERTLISRTGLVNQN